MLSLSEKIEPSIIMSLAHNDLLAYARLQFPSFKIGWHHRKIADALMAVERGEITRLIIQAPPRHTKSMLTSEFFPAWYIGRNPNKFIVTATYAQDLANDFGRKVRNQLKSPEHMMSFPACQIAGDSQAADKFSTEQGGSYFAVGVGGPLTGRGAHILLIDDPFKGREEADSETMRKRLKDWYKSVAYTRLMPGGVIIIMNTRWHEDDLTGWVLSEHQHENWHVLNLPALDSDNRALWPEWYDEAALERIRQTVGAREWNALYMQQPMPDEGDYFKKSWFNHYDVKPTNLRIYAASDFAVTSDEGDFTEHGIFGIDESENIYVLDWWSGQTSSDVWIESLLDLSVKWRPEKWVSESGVIRRSIEPFLRKRMEERKIYQLMHWEPSIANKPTRCRSFQARASMGKVYLPKTSWADELLLHLCSFPVGVFDDKADVCGLIGRIIDKTFAAQAPVIKQQSKPGTFDWLVQYDNQKPTSKYRR